MRLKTVEGISIGNLGEPREPIVRKIKDEYEVTICPQTVVNWRSGRNSPLVTANRVRACNLLKANDASQKDNLYLAIAKSGVKQRRTKNRFDFDPAEGAFSSENFTAEVSVDIELKQLVVERAIRAMRAEIVHDQRQLTEDHRRMFVGLGEIYLQHHLDPRSQVYPKKYKFMEEKWDRTIPSFYKLLYAGGGGRFLGGWTPYEVDYLSFFYEDRIIKGSPLSSLDILVLDSCYKGANLPVLVNEVRNKTGIAVDRGPLTEHRNFLLYGKPRNPNF